MATIVAASGGGNWNATGTWVGGVVPTASDDVQLGSTSGAVTINVTSVCRSLDCTGYTNTLTWSAQLTIGTTTAGASNIALKLVAGMTLTWTAGGLIFSSSSATQQTIAFAGKSGGWNITFQTGGSWQLQDALSTTGSSTLTQGTLDCNNQNYTAAQFASVGASTRVLTMGSGTFTFSGSSPWTVSGSNVTITANTSSIVCTSGSSPVFAGGGFTYHDLSFTASGGTGTESITGANTFNNVTANTGAAKTAIITFSANQTINGTLTLSGNSATNRLLVSSATNGTAITLTAAAISMANVDLMDITGAGAASWDLHAITGLSGDCGGNSGITFTTAATQTWQTPTVNGSWSTSANWTSRVPLPQDDVVVSYTTAAKTITADMPRSGHNIDFSGTSAASLTLSLGVATRVYGNLDLTHVTTISGSTLIMTAHALNTLTTGGVSLGVAWQIDSSGSSGIQLQDNWSGSGSLNLVGGTLDVNGFTYSSTSSFTASTNTWTISLGGGSFTVTTFTSGSTTRTINFGTNGVVNLSATSASTVWSLSAGSLTSTGTGSIVISTTSANTRTFAGAGFTYPTLAYTVAGSTGALVVTGANTFAGINFSDASNARTLTLPSSTTTTVSGPVNIVGTSGKLMTINSSTSGTTATLSLNSGVVANCDFLSLKDSTASGSGKAYAGANSTIVSNVSGWKTPIKAASGGGNWSSTSTWTGAVVPTADDDVLLAATSGNVTIDAAAACRSIDCTGYTGTLTHNTGITLSVGTNSVNLGGFGLRFVSGMTYTKGSGTAAFSFVSTSSAVAGIDWASKSLGTVTFNGAGGAWQILSAFTVQANVTLSSGALDINGQTCTWSSSFISTSGTRTLTLGAASITVTTAWNVVSSGLTFNAGTSSITLTSNGATFTGGSLTYNNLTFTATSGNGQTLNGANTFANLTVTGPADEHHVFTIGASQTITGTLTLNGNSALNRLFVRTATTGTSYTLTAATVAASNLDLMDITGAGAGSWDLHAITGNSGDCKGNAGITFTSSATQTWSGTSSGNWSSNAWTSRVPLPQDDVVISGAFSAATITVDVPRVGRSITFTGTTGTLTWTSSSYTLMVFGSITLTSAVTPAGSAGIVLAGRGSQTLTSAGKSYSTNLEFDGFGGTYTLQDDLATTDLISLASGALAMNGHNVTSTTFDGSSTNARALTMGSGTWNLSSTAAGSLWNMAAAGMTLSAASSTIAITGASTSTRTFTGGGLTYGALTYSVAASTGQLSIVDANTFDSINFSDASNARTLQLPASATTTINTAFNVQGTSGKLMSVVSSSGGTAATVSKASGIVSCDYLSLKDSTATGGAGWYAGTHSTNVSGNTGWNFSAGPSIFSKTQTAVARIKATPTKTQTAVARIKATPTKTQTAVARIKATPTKTQTAVARIKATPTKTQTAVARIKATPTKTQTAVARIKATPTKTQTAVARIKATPTKTQTAVARIKATPTKTQTAVARVSLRSIKTQSAQARVAANRTKTQSATAHIVSGFVAHQTATARISLKVTHTVTALARIALSKTHAQTAVSRLALNGLLTQSATAKIAFRQTHTQSAEARITATRLVTQTAKGRIAQKRLLTHPANAAIITGASFIGSKTQSATACISLLPTATPCDLDIEVTQRNFIDMKVSAG